MKRILYNFCFFLFICSAVFPQSSIKIDYETLAKTGTNEEIVQAFKVNQSLNRQVFGDNKETFLILVLKEKRDATIISTCINRGCEVNIKTGKGCTPLMYAARYSEDENIIDLIVKKVSTLNRIRGKYVLEEDNQGLCAFDYARQNPNYAVYSKLCQYAQDPKGFYDQKDAPQIEETPPHEETLSPLPPEPDTSTSNQNSAEVEQSANEPVNPSPSEPNKSTSSQGSVNIVQPTNESANENTKTTQISPPAGAQIEPPDSVIENPTVSPDTENVNEKESSLYLWDYANQKEENEQSSSESIPYGSLIENPNEADKNGVTLLMKAARSGSDWDIDLLLQSGCDVNLRDKDGWTALMYAVRYQNSLEIVEKLIDNGAHVRVRNKYNATPLLLAANYSQNPDILARLLQGRNSLEDEVMRAFIFSITGSTLSPHVQQAKIKLFLDMGMPLNNLWKGETPLMYAAQYAKSNSVIEQLLSAGADPLIQDENGKTAFDYAKKNTNLKHDNVFWALNGVDN